MKRGLFILSILFMSTFILAETSLDIVGLNSKDYSTGEDLKFSVLVLEDGAKITQEVEIKVYDLKKETLITRITESGKEISVTLEKKFQSGLWTIEATSKNETIERTFKIKEKTSVDFSIEEGVLIIKNTGNIRYQKTIQITIGQTKQSKTLNIPVGEQKEWKLVAPEGVYDIHVTDGENTVSKKNIKLVGGTGNVIGAIDENLIGYSGFGTTPTETLEDRFISLNKLPMTIIFLIVVFGLGILIAIERTTRKRETGAPKQVIQNVV